MQEQPWKAKGKLKKEALIVGS